MQKRHRWLLAGLLPLAILVMMIGLNGWLFRSYTDTHYLVWYLQNGALISIAVGFLALIWEGLESREGLLSAHPGEYLAACFGLLAVLFNSLSVHLSNPLQGRQHDDLGFASAITMLWDSAVAILVFLVIGLMTLAWLVVVAPLNYFVTLVSGAVARQHLRGTLLRAVVVRRDRELIVTALPAEEALPADTIDVSFARKPFAVTQAVTSLLLWIAKVAYNALM